MRVLGYDLQATGPRRFARHVNGMMLVAHFHREGDVSVTVVRMPDLHSEVRVESRTTTLDEAVADVARMLWAELPGWARRLGLKEV